MDVIPTVREAKGRNLLFAGSSTEPNFAARESFYYKRSVEIVRALPVALREAQPEISTSE
jgi:hypothetical protein